MTEQQVREAIRLRGWTFLRRQRWNRSYVYAARRIRGTRKEVYIGSVTSLARLTTDQLTAKLDRNAA